MAPPDESDPHLKPTLPTNLDPQALGLFEDILDSGSSLRVRVTGRSMTPFLRAGDVVVIRKVPVSSLRIGDLIFFKNRQGFPMLHRVVRRRRGPDGKVVLQTKGDSLTAFDRPIEGDRVLGKVCQIERADSAAGSKRSINLESPLWDTINSLIAVITALRSKAHHGVLRLAPLLPFCKSDDD